MLSFRFDYLLQDCDPGFEVWRLDIGHESGLESRQQPVLEPPYIFGRAVGGEDNLFAGLMKGVESMKELLLSRFFAGQKLDIVEKKEVDAPVEVFWCAMASMKSLVNFSDVT
jgi:hypothetical protein